MSADQIIAIVMDDKTYEVNKKKLIEKSDYFRALYSSGMRESTEDSVQLQGLSVPGLELVLEFINTSKVQVVNETLEDLIETASFLQVTSILKLLTSEIRLDNCVELYSLSEVYGTHDLRKACLKYMSCYYHPMLRRPEFSGLPSAVRDQVKEMRMKGTATLVAIGDFTCLSLDVPDRDEPWSMLRYGEVEQRWKPLANNLPPDMINVRGYGSAVLDNYLFIVGGYRMTSQEISAVHCYNPCRNEWNQVASLNQKRSNFKLLAVQGKLYAVGGQCLGTVECYSPEQDWWTCVSSMPDPLAEFSACECQGMIYVMGGYTARGWSGGGRGGEAPVGCGLTQSLIWWHSVTENTVVNEQKWHSSLCQHRCLCEGEWGSLSTTTGPFSLCVVQDFVFLFFHSRTPSPGQPHQGLSGFIWLEAQNHMTCSV